MNLVQLLIPLQDNDGQAYPRAFYDDLVRTLTDVFGGITAYTRSPAAGLWETGSGETVRDQVMVYEVMVEELDEGWWTNFRAELEAKFDQEELVIRAHGIRRL